MEIKTLSEILLENNLSTSKHTYEVDSSKPIIAKKSTKASVDKPNIPVTPISNKKSTKIKDLENKNSVINSSQLLDSFEYSKRLENKSKIDNITEKLKEQLKTTEQRQVEINDIKEDSRLRWLAFYYLSTREHSAEELKRKLLAKNQNPKKIDELLTEFAEKGYQSDMRTALMLIREGIRKGRGRRRIKQDFFHRQIDLPANIDELIDMANTESSEFIDLVDNNGTASMNWLKLAVEARVKKYGQKIPSENKEKAKQLRFLQYRGFSSEICFEAIKHNLMTI